MVRLLLTGFMCIIFSASNLHAQNEDIQTKIDAIANSYINLKSNRALAIVYVDEGKSFQLYYGETNKGKGIKPNKNSVFEIGAVSSVFTTTLLADLEFKQKLSTDDELRKFLPEDVIVPFYQNIVCKAEEDVIGVTDDPDYKPVKLTPYICVPDANSDPEEIKLCYLASHTAGLPYLPSNFKKGYNKQDPFAHYTKENLYSFLKNYNLKHALGTDYKYSRTGIALLGLALELNQKKTIEELYNEHIWSPLEMSQSSVATTNSGDEKLLQGHTKKGKSAKPYHYRVFAPYSGIRSTPGDMQKFLEANLNAEKHSLSNAVTLAQQGRLKINQKKLKDSEIGLGWYISPIPDGNKVIWQKGNTAGHSCFIGMLKDKKSGVVIMANNDTSLDEMALEILKLLE